jgi:TolA-binding protein
LLVHQTSLSVFDQPVTVFQRFLTTYPHSKYAEQVNEILASAFLSSKDYTAALNAINTLKSPGKQILAAKQAIYFRLGTENFVNKNYAAAGKYFDDCIAMGAYDPKARNESCFWKGEIAYRNANYTQAANQFKAYLTTASVLDENYALAFYNLAYSYFQLKQHANALPNFQRYISAEKDRKKPNYSDALNRIGDCCLYNRNFAEAERYYAQAAAANPAVSDYAEFQRAFVQGLQRDYTGKIATLDNMMRKYPSSPYYDDALFEKSRALVMLGREQDAIAVIEKLMREQPQSPLGRKAGVQLGQLYFNANNHSKAIAAYKQVVATYPHTEEARMAIVGLESVYKDLNDIQSYLAYVNSAGMGTLVSESKQDSLSYLAAENAYMKGPKAQAKTVINNYLKTYPNGRFAGNAHYLLGLTAVEEKDTDTALKEFGEAAQAGNPEYQDDALLYISNIQFERKNYEAAYAAYEKLSRVASSAENRNTAFLGMLRSASQTGADKDVIAAATALLKNEKTSPESVAEATYYRAKASRRLGQTDAAMKDFQTLSADTRNVFGAEAQYILAETFFKWKSYDKAKKQVQGFMKQGTPHQYWLAKALIVLSDCFAAEGDAFQSKQYLESLKANYKGGEQDIRDEIDKRLK